MRDADWVGLRTVTLSVMTTGPGGHEETYQTTDSPSPFLVESEIAMTRRFFQLGRTSPSRWRRIMVWALYLLVMAGLAATVVGLIVFVFRVLG